MTSPLPRSTQVLFMRDSLKVVGVHAMADGAEMVALQSLRKGPSGPFVGEGMGENDALSKSESPIAFRANGARPKMASIGRDDDLGVEPLIRRTNNRAMAEVRLERSLGLDLLFGLCAVLMPGKRRGMVPEYVSLSRASKFPTAAFARLWLGTQPRLPGRTRFAQVMAGSIASLGVARIHGLATSALTRSNVRRPTKSVMQRVQMVARNEPHRLTLDPPFARARLRCERGQLFTSTVAVHEGIIP